MRMHGMLAAVLAVAAIATATQAQEGGIEVPPDTKDIHVTSPIYGDLVMHTLPLDWNPLPAYHSDTGPMIAPIGFCDWPSPRQGGCVEDAPVTDASRAPDDAIADRPALVARLARTRTGLVRTYVLHVAWFAAMCAFTAMRWNQDGLKFTVLLTLVTVPPVLVYTVRAHRLCRALDPKARTVGLVPVVVTTLVLSPFESGLVLPLKNLLEANRLLRQSRVPQPVDDPVGTNGAATEQA